MLKITRCSQKLFTPFKHTWRPQLSILATFLSRLNGFSSSDKLFLPQCTGGRSEEGPWRRLNKLFIYLFFNLRLFFRCFREGSERSRHVFCWLDEYQTTLSDAHGKFKFSLVVCSDEHGNHLNSSLLTLHLFCQTLQQKRLHCNLSGFFFKSYKLLRIKLVV